MNGPIVRRVLTPEEEAAEKAKHEAAPAGMLRQKRPKKSAKAHPAQASLEIQGVEAVPQRLYPVERTFRSSVHQAPSSATVCRAARTPA